MAVLDDALTLGKRGLRGAADYLNRAAGQPASAPTVNVPPTAGGAMPPPPTVPGNAPMPPAAASQGVRMTAQEASRLGVPSPEAAAYQASRTAAPVAAATPEAAATNSAFSTAGKVMTKAAPAVAGTVAGLGIASGIDGLSTPTDVYARRLGIDTSDKTGSAFDNTPLGRAQQFGKDIGTRSAGVVSDFGANLLDVGTGVVNGVRTAFGSKPISSFNDMLRANDGPNPTTAPVVPLVSNATAATVPPAQPSIVTPGSPQTPPVSPAAAATTGLPPGITRSGNAFTNVGPDGTANPAPTQPLANTGVRFASDADIARLKNAPAPNDPNALFSNANGTAVATGSPMGSEPRMQVSAGPGIGGLIVQHSLNRQRALDIQQQQVLGDQALRGQDLGLRREQMGFDRKYRYDELGHRIDHDNATVGVSRDQLTREGLRDAATAQHARNEESIARDRNAAEFGLRRDQLNREQQGQDFGQSQSATKAYGDEVAGSIPNQLRDAKGNVDPNIVAEHVQNAHGLVTTRISQLQSELQQNPNNANARKVLADYQSRGVAALSPKDKEHVQMATEFGQLARIHGTSDFNPIGGTNVEMRTPVDHIRHESQLTGDVYRGYDAQGKPLPVTVPARAIERDGGFVGGTRNQRFKNLIR